MTAEPEHKRLNTNGQTMVPQLPFFIQDEEKLGANFLPPNLCLLNAARDWEMCVDLSQRLTFPSKMAMTNLHTDLVFWSNSCQCVFIVELMVPWEDATDEAFDCDTPTLQQKQRSEAGM